MTHVKDSERRRVLVARLPNEEFKTSSSLVKVDVDARSHEGSVRSTNDDHYLVLKLSRTQQTIATSLTEADIPEKFEERGFAMLVADGLGPSGAASVASRAALSAIAHLGLHFSTWNLRIDPRVADEVAARAERLYAEADEAVSRRRESSPMLANISTALTAAYSVGDHLFVGHIGHSRAYLFRNGTLTQLTRDHTTAQRVSETGKPVVVPRHRQDLAHIITDTLGLPGERPKVLVEHFRLVSGDAVLLCTNGLTDMVNDERIAETLSMRRKSKEQCRLLVNLANRMGGQDNVTVILAQYEVPKGAC